MVIQHNLQAQNTNRQLGVTGGVLSKSTEKLSSGYRINRAADDAAGLAISEKMRFQVRGLNKASSNASDGISLIQTAEGALNEVHAILNRMKELSTQAANDTNTDIDRQSIQEEIDELTSEIDRIASTTQFNTMNLLDGSLSEVTEEDPYDANPYFSAFQFGNQVYTFELVDANGDRISNVSETEGLVGSMGNLNGVENNFSGDYLDLANFVKDAASSAVGKLYDAYGSLFSNASSNGVKVGLELGNIDGQRGTLAFVQVAASSSTTRATMGYKMKVDTSDYNPANFASMSDADKANLAATIAHEMTHAVMDDTLTTGMMGSGEYPKWFKEGMAQTSSGDGTWFTGSVPVNATDSQISNYMKDSNVRNYGAGYVAAMYLGHLASGASATDAPTAASIKTGLGNVLSDLSTGKTLNEVIASRTNDTFAGVTEFENKVFNNPDADTIAFVKNLRAAIGSGAGSVLAPSLSTTQNSAFAPGSMSATGTNYTIDLGYSAMLNKFNGGIDWERGGTGDDPSGRAESKGGLNLQVGALSGQKIVVNIDAMNAVSIGIKGLSMASFEDAGTAMEKIDKAIDKVSTQRSKLGAKQNRLEHTVLNLDNTSENVDSAESRIRDTDMAREMVKHSTANILQQAGQAMLAQANQSTQGILSLIA